MCPLSVLVQHPSRDGDEGDPRWISRWTTNLLYADDIILLATSELVDRLDRVSRKYILINVDKTKVTASDGIACRILIQNEQLEQVDTFTYLGSLITEDGECRPTTELRTRLNKGQALHLVCITAENMEKSQHTDFNEDMTNESASVACSNVRL